LIQAFDAFFKNPRVAEVYNIGGGRFSNCSMLEAIALSEQITGKELNWKYEDGNRAGDHVWWIGDLTKFQSDYPEWQLSYNIDGILRESYEMNIERWQHAGEEVAA
jgi:CDP-paratose 2-epimerase